MRKILLIALATAVAGTALAQGAFTIRRPVEGSTVREVVKFRVPKNSIPDGGYLGVYINGLFVEAVMPDIEDKDYVYGLDTQARKLSDGKTKVELVLFQDVDGRPRILNRSAVNIVIDNSTSIRVPAAGRRLRYSFVPGTERVYVYRIAQEVSTVSQAQAQLGGRGFTTGLEEQTVRILHAIDNAYTVSGQREGLMRIQILPDKGRETATIIPTGQSNAQEITREEMDPIYMRITDVGREVFTTFPLFFGIEGSNGTPPQKSWIPLLPMPVLPAKPVKPGDVWQTAQLISNSGGEGLMHLIEKDKAMASLPSRGVFEGVTWYKGIPCAKITASLALGKDDLKGIKNLNQLPGEATKVELKELLWFALDRGIVVRRETRIEQQALIESAPRQAQQGGGSGGASAGQPPNAPRAAGAAGGGSSGAANFNVPGMPEFGPADFEFKPGYNSNGEFQFFQQRGRRRGGPAGAGNPGGGQDELSPNTGQGESGARGGARGPGAARGAGGQKVIIKVTLSIVAELER